MVWKYLLMWAAAYVVCMLVTAFRWTLRREAAAKTTWMGYLPVPKGCEVDGDRYVLRDRVRLDDGWEVEHVWDVTYRDSVPVAST